MKQHRSAARLYREVTDDEFVGQAQLKKYILRPWCLGQLSCMNTAIGHHSRCTVRNQGNSIDRDRNGREWWTKLKVKLQLAVDAVKQAFIEVVAKKAE